MVELNHLWRIMPPGHALRQGVSVPSLEEITQAQTLGKELAELSANNEGKVQIQIRQGSRSVNLQVPHTVMELLVRIVEQMAAGNAVTLFPVHALLSTQEAANLLNVSRPYLVRLLEELKLPYHQIGTHRKIRLEDLIAYQEKIRAESQIALEELTRLGQELEQDP